MPTLTLDYKEWKALKNILRSCKLQNDVAVETFPSYGSEAFLESIKEETEVIVAIEAEMEMVEMSE